MAVVEAGPMTKGAPSGSTVRVDPELLLKLKRIVALSDKPMRITDYVNNLIRGPIERDYERVMKKLRESDS